MDNRKIPVLLRMLMASALALSLLFGTASCSMIEDILGISETEETHKPRRNNDSKGSKQEKGVKESAPTDPTDPTDPTNPTNHTGIYNTDPTGVTVVDLDLLRNVYVYSAWYDVIEDNPAYYDEVASEDAFALKAVFYFRTPLTCRFEAKLYKDNEVLLTRYVDLNENVTADADFSAGLEGFGTFEPGSYYVELCFEGVQVGCSSTMKVV